MEEVLGQGKFLRLIRQKGWEYAIRTKPVRAAFIAAVTKTGRLVLTKEFRIPVDKEVIGFPASLIGDTAGHEGESLEAGVNRELLEEAGYQAEKITVLTQGPTSPGQIDEVIAVVLAEGLKKIGKGGGVDGEQLSLLEVPLPKVHGWLEKRVREGCLVDPKVYTGLYFIHMIRPELLAAKPKPKRRAKAKPRTARRGK